MRFSPSIVPPDRLDRDIYLVLEDFAPAPAAPGARPTKPSPTSRQSSEISCPANTPIRSGLCASIRADAASDDTDAEVPSALQDFIAANATRRFDVQLALPLPAAA
jgi:hypothetical protein